MVGRTLKLLLVTAVLAALTACAAQSAFAYTAPAFGTQVASSDFNTDPHVIVAFAAGDPGNITLSAESDENGATSTWTINFSGGTMNSGDVAAPCSLALSTITCTVAAATLAEGIEIWTGAGSDAIVVTDAGAAGDIAPAAIFSRGAANGDTQSLVGGRGADLLNTSDENSGMPSAALMVGHQGKDFFEGGSNSLDIIGYGELGRAGPVTAKLDCNANDGSQDFEGAFQYENVGCAATSIEGLEGSAGGDLLVGDGGSNMLYGLGGGDTIKGGDATDTISGGNDNDTLEGQGGSDFYWGDDGPGDSQQDGTLGDGDDTINAADGIADHTVDCGGGGADVANLDALATDAAAVTNCETVSRASGEPAPGPGPNPGNPPSGVTTRVPVQDTTKTYVLDDLRGYTLDEIALLFWLAGVNADFRGSKPIYRKPKDLPEHPRGEKWRIGDVIYHETAIGRTLTHSAGRPARIDLRYWVGPAKEACLKEAKDFKGFNIDEFKNTMSDLGCKIDDLLPAFVKKVEGDDKCAVGKLSKGNRASAVDAVVNVPRDPSKHDLFIGLGIFKKIAPAKNNYRTDIVGSPLAPGWTVPRGAKTSLSGAVIGRTGNWVGNVTVYFDTSGVRSSSTTDSFHVTTSMDSGKPGQFTTPVFMANKEGTIDILALGMDKNGNAACGATQIKVEDFRRKKGALLTNTSGRVYQFTPGESKPFTVRNDLAASAGARAAAGNWWDGAVAWWNSLWAGKPGAQSAPTQKSAATNGQGLAQFGLGRPLSASALPASVTSGSMVAAGGLNLTGAGGQGQMVAAGAGNLIFATTGMVAAGAGNMVAAGAGNLVAAGGGNIGGPVVDVSRSSIRDIAGVKLIGLDGGTMVAAGAGNMVAAGAGNLIGPDGGSLIGQDGGS